MTKGELAELLKTFSIEEIGRLLGRSSLSDTAILRHMKNRSILIEPFNKNNLGTCSYDVTLGEYFYREQSPRNGINIYNPWSKKDVRRVWGKKSFLAESAKTWVKKHGTLEGVASNDRIILIEPGETILCHTNEFIGGRGGIVTTMMKARSSLGRNFIEICKCAGWGDVGFVNRWTMEITNNSRYYRIPLVVGRRVAQITFFEVEQILDKDYSKSGKYQSSNEVNDLKKRWKPEDMLPKMYQDREVSKSV